jgi:hypothetical protein
MGKHFPLVCARIGLPSIGLDPAARPVGSFTHEVPVPANKLSDRVKASDVTGVVTENKTAFDMPPPGLGFVTVTAARFIVAISVARMAAVTWLVLTNVVVRVCPFHLTVAPLTNPAPFTVSVNPGPPGATAAGTVGLFTKGTALVCAANGEQNIERRMPNMNG